MAADIQKHVHIACFIPKVLGMLFLLGAAAILTNHPLGTAFGAYSIWVRYQTRQSRITPAES